MALVAALLLAGLAALIYVHLDRPVLRVSVVGQLDDAEREQIRTTVRSQLRGGMLSADLDGLSSAILELSWPREVTVRRNWPETLQISVEKPAVVAAWRDAYLASDGQVVRLPGGRSNLPRFECSLAEPRQAMEIFHRLSRAGSRDGLRVERLTENPLGEWGATLTRTDAEGEVNVVLGAESVMERFDRFLVVYRQHLAGRLAEIARVDARYDNGVAVSWSKEDPEPTLVAARRTAPAEPSDG
ncbi:MAG TPA: FtsQ-type POTRA domain-containing protein [Pseudomonadales bacterium]